MQFRLSPIALRRRGASRGAGLAAATALALLLPLTGGSLHAQAEGNDADGDPSWTPARQIPIPAGQTVAEHGPGGAVAFVSLAGDVLRVGHRAGRDEPVKLSRPVEVRHSTDAARATVLDAAVAGNRAIVAWYFDYTVFIAERHVGLADDWRVTYRWPHHGEGGDPMARVSLGPTGVASLEMRASDIMGYITDEEHITRGEPGSVSDLRQGWESVDIPGGFVDIPGRFVVSWENTDAGLRLLERRGGSERVRRRTTLRSGPATTLRRATDTASRGIAVLHRAGDHTSPTKGAARLSRRAPDGRWIDADVPAPTTHDVDLILSLEATAILELDGEGDQTRLTLTRVGLDGNVDPPVTVAAPGASDPHAALLPDGRAAITWSRQAGDSGEHRATAAVVQADGTTGPAVPLAGWQSSPPGARLSVGSSGTAAVTFWDQAGRFVERFFADDTDAPTARFDAPRRKVTLGGTARAAWRASDATTGVRTLEVRRRTAVANGGGGRWDTWRRTTAPAGSTNARVWPGRTACWSVRATDVAGNTAGWSRARCTTAPFDDRALRAGPAWDRLRDAGALRRTSTMTSRKGATLRVRGIAARRLAIVARTGPGAGRVVVRHAGRRVGVVSLRSPRVRRQRVLPLPGTADVRRGRLVLRVLSSGRRVEIDGVVAVR